MAQYYVNYSCGCTEKIELFGKVNARHELIERLEKGACPACRIKAAMSDSSFVPLKGSLKQVAWAVEIRADASKEIANAVKVIVDTLINDYDWDAAPTVAEAQQAIDGAIEKIMSNTSASYWIDNRYKNWPRIVEAYAVKRAEKIVAARVAQDDEDNDDNDDDNGAETVETEPTVATVDVNSADASALRTIRGVGRVLAARIAAFVASLGRALESLDELLAVRGIGAKTLAKIRVAACV